MADPGDMPHIYVDEVDQDGCSTERLTLDAEGARNLAALLLEAAAEIDDWARK